MYVTILMTRKDEVTNREQSRAFAMIHYQVFLDLTRAFERQTPLLRNTKR